MTPDELTEMAQSYMDKSKPKSVFAFAKALEAVILMEREACAKDAEWCIQNHLEHLMPERIRGRSNP